MANASRIERYQKAQKVVSKLLEQVETRGVT